MKRSAGFTVCAIALGVSAVALAGQSTAPSVETATVVAKALEKTITIPGDLTPYQGVNLTARVAGFVESLNVDRGSWVKRGQLLAKISAPELRAQRAEAEAKLQAGAGAGGRGAGQDGQCREHLLTSQGRQRHAGSRGGKRPRDRRARPRSRACARQPR